MSAAGFLEKLLDGGDVAWVPLEEVATIKHGRDWKHLNEGDIPVYSSGGIMGYVDEYSYGKPTVLIPRKGSITNIFFVETPLWNVDTIYYTEIDESQIVPKFFYYFICTLDMMSMDTGSGRPSLTQSILNKIEVPIPCPDDPKKSLAIQGEIVRILDSFTELTAELTAELNQRKKQYNHYRDQLLTFDEDEVEWRTLGEVADFQNAKPHEKLVTKDGDVALLTAGYISSDGKSARFVKSADVLTPAIKNDVAMVMSDLPNGRALAKTFFVDENGRFAANQRVCLFRVKDPESYSPRFLHYIMNRNRQLLRYDSGFDQTHLKKDWILNVKLPVPSLAEQARIVAILDKFDTLTTSISEGLPREIELREKQYAYYRDQLLSFPKPDAEAA